MFKPQLFETLKSGYSLEKFARDGIAGIIVGIVAIPLAVTFAIASGVRPDVGLLTAVIGGVLVSLLGGSPVQIGGPTGAFIVIVYGILEKYGPQGLIIATAMAGLILIILGFAKLGSIIQFIPFPVIVGFTSGIAVIILSSQINDFFGLGIEKVPAGFIEKWTLYFRHIDGINWWATAIALGTIVVVVLMRKWAPKIPGTLVALLLGTGLALIFKLPLETIGSRFGEISGNIPPPGLPSFNFELLGVLLMPALSIAMLGGIESLLSAVVADGMVGSKHNANTELIGQGLANVASAFFGGLPVTGAIARTATNIKSGGRSPIAGIIHGVFLLGVLLFLSPLTAYIPLACLAGILATVAYNMSEHHTFRMLLHGPRGDILALLVTFTLTVVVDLTLAIPVGIGLALLGFIQKMSTSSRIQIQAKTFQDVPPEMDPFGLTAIKLPEGVEVLEIDGPLFFGAAEGIKEELAKLHHDPRILIVRMRNVPSIDASGAMVIRTLVERKAGTQHVFSALQPQVRKVFDSIGLTRLIGEEFLVPNIVVAISKARELLGVDAASLVPRFQSGCFLWAYEFTGIDALMADLTNGSTLPQEYRPALIQYAIDRERIASTALQEPLAFPHPAQSAFKDPALDFISVAIFAEPRSDWDSEGHRVQVAILIAAHSSQEHLILFSRLGKLLKNKDFITELIGCRSKEAALDVVKAYEDHSF